MGMHNAARIIAGLVLILMESVQSCAQTNTGTIAGVVVDEREHPVAGALVTTRNLDLPPNTVEVWGAVVPYVGTDDHGRFVFRGLELNHRYKVYAKERRRSISRHDVGPMHLRIAGQWQRRRLREPEKTLRSISGRKLRESDGKS